MDGMPIDRAAPGGTRARSWTAICVAAILGVAGCGGATPASTSPGTSASTTPAATPASTTVAPTAMITAAPTPAASIVARDVAYQTADPLLDPDKLDVYAPGAGGPWPVVVMFHGQPATTEKGFLAEHAQRLAAAGYVVFNASWGHLPMFSSVRPDPYVYAAATRTQIACALAYAAAHAADFEGDPDTLTVFGHSGGSNAGSVAAFDPVAPTAGCATQGDPVQPDVLVAMDGNWLLDPGFDATLAADSRIFDLMTPWSVLEKRPNLPVVMLMAETPGSDIEAPMPAESVGPYLALRDRDGVLADLVAKLHPFDDGLISMSDMQPMLLERLRENGNPVTLTVVPGSTHTTFRKDSWPVFLAAFDQALAAARP